MALLRLFKGRKLEPLGMSQRGVGKMIENLARETQAQRAILKRQKMIAHCSCQRCSDWGYKGD
jgi:hypothetical protein